MVSTTGCGPVNRSSILVRKKLALTELAVVVLELTLTILTASPHSTGQDDELFLNAMDKTLC